MLVVEDECGRRGYGEAAPLYWAAEGSLAEVGRELERAARALVEGAQVLSGARPDPHPAVACAVDTALLDLEARQRGLAAAELLGGAPAARVPCSALVCAASPDEAASEAAALCAAGYRVLKVKLGGAPLAGDLERVRSIRRACGGRVRLRLDANRSWAAETALQALRALAGGDVEYVEEPLAISDLARWRWLRAEAGVPLAADESVREEGDVEALARAGACDVVVIKLVRAGGPRRALAVARRALQCGLRVVFTDALETEVGRAAAAHTAAALGHPSEAVGLGGAMLLAAGDRRAHWGPRPVYEIRGPGLGCGELQWTGA